MARLSDEKVECKGCGIVQYVHVECGRCFSCGCSCQDDTDPIGYAVAELDRAMAALSECVHLTCKTAKPLTMADVVTVRATTYGALFVTTAGLEFYFSLYRFASVVDDFTVGQCEVRHALMQAANAEPEYKDFGDGSKFKRDFKACQALAFRDADGMENYFRLLVRLQLVVGKQSANRLTMRG